MTKKQPQFQIDYKGTSTFCASCAPNWRCYVTVFPLQTLSAKENTNAFLKVSGRSLTGLNLSMKTVNKEGIEIENKE